MKDLLIRQFNQRSKMQIQDMVKLIYQNEFAGGHFIKNETESLHRLYEECRHFERHFSDKKIHEDIFEDIGNGLCRFYLSALVNNGLQIETLNRFFINTSNSVNGSVQSFEQKLGILVQCCRNGQLPYPVEELGAYLKSYKLDGYPPVSHSEIYRTVYTPAYRIVGSIYRDYFEVFLKIDSLLKTGKTIIAAIDGNSGAGKSTLASLIGQVYDCNIFHMDHFFLSLESRTEERLKEVGGNVDYARFDKEIISGIHSNGEFSYRIFDCKQNDYTQSIDIAPKRLNIVEGSYSMHPTLAPNYDLKIFLHVDEKEQKRRILKRNGLFMLERFIEEWIPKENRYFDAMSIREQCDLVFP